jgi:hypothetical protein
MADLRQKIIGVLESIDGYRGLEHEQQADAILEIPEIRVALRYSPVGTIRNIVTKEGGTVHVPNPRRG